jgi:type IV secretory pathway TrbD component
MMVKNMGSADRIIRTVLGIGGIVLGFVLGGLWWIAAGLGVVFLATSTISFCPLYAPFKISTRKRA